MRNAQKPGRGPAPPGSSEGAPTARRPSEVPSSHARRRRSARAQGELGHHDARVVVGFVTPPLARALAAVWGEVIVCADLEEAVRACSSHRPQVVIVDEDCLESPEQMVAELKMVLGGACPVVLLLTSFPWLDGGADRTLQKPVDATSLAGVLDALQSSGCASEPRPPVGDTVDAPVHDPLPESPRERPEPASGKVRRSPGRYQLEAPASGMPSRIPPSHENALPLVVVAAAADRDALCAVFRRVATEVITADPEQVLDVVRSTGRCIVAVWAPDPLDTLILASVLPPGVSLLSIVPVTDGRRGRTLRRSATGFELDWPAPMALLRRALSAVRSTSIPPPSGP
jgi:hypothetical protein